MRPADILPDTINVVQLNGVNVRKGSVAAFLVNARMLVAENTSDEARRDAEAHIQALVPSLLALGLFDQLEIRDPRVRAVVERARDESR